ncbi:haloacid dehalogenase superfamily, subfamily IA, variant 3 with third motif having DD or ED [Andreprevotia lacus DSM 23236]|jgi:HAD superfamily hydrolase (TIGR01509 family)|uniref:Haloacid dehalogenase superfamily, subfamily IA, variant 3 with third motif having DD or ED n=1 Tax=Andreprevotia lacus DSM 23236 TaxID=1121001 RepID=A0A1W1XCY4_9NEIS|nr:HAD family phosphatase [Andreprevotia lacus]SMC21722.1 haloacid dehalogenase superfamily, subfamily IA, variant 3 with third motif having DD or ED [Andreprevotia lacus DSM 23236]
MTAAPIRAALFDMDGLMLDTERIACRAWHDAAGQLGITLADEVVLGMVGMHSSKVDAWLISQLGDDAPIHLLREATHERYLQLTEGAIPHKPGLIALLDWLKAQGLPIGVATSTRRSIAEHHLKAAGLWPYFAFAVCGDEIEHPKPAPDIYLKAAGLHGVPPQDCVVFEDSNFGVRAGHSADCRVIMVPDLRQPTPETLALGVAVVPSLVEGLQLLASWQGEA